MKGDFGQIVEILHLLDCSRRWWIWLREYSPFNSSLGLRDTITLVLHTFYLDSNVKSIHPVYLILLNLILPGEGKRLAFSLSIHHPNTKTENKRREHQPEE